ncbi:hypothetical protein JXM67_03195 [candidate division WOR-3 bacterium]|nr:hypothetical protein [candidate division WOR-3 bacterium]
MSDLNKWVNAREWIKTIMPLAVLGVGWCLSYLVINKAEEKAKARQLEIQAVEQQRSNDIAVSQSIFEILSEERTNLYPWLSGLVSTIRDSSLREIIDSAVQANPRLPDDIKANVRARTDVVLGTLSVDGIEKENRDSDEIGMLQEDYQEIIIFMEDDTEAALRSQNIYNYLKSLKFNCKEEYKSFDWYIRYYVHTRSGSLKDTAEVNYYGLNDEEKTLAYCIYRALSNHPELGNFKLRINQQRVFPRGKIGIVIPNTIKNPLEIY